jgi:stalled ribosome rescue protein Dom34
LETYLEDFNSEKARLRIKGQVTNAENGTSKKFNDAGELISILGKWNSEKFQRLRKAAKNSR